MIDEAFVPLHALLPNLLPLTEPIVDVDAGIRQLMTGCEVQTPIELDLSVEGDVVQIGAVPPLYHLETSYPPVLHAVRLVVVSEANHG